MAGYMTKLTNYVFEGELPYEGALEPENGMGVELNAAGTAFKLPAAADNVKGVVKEVTTIYDAIKAYRIVVTEVAKPTYFVENIPDSHESEFDFTKWKHPKGKLGRNHPIQVGDELLTDQCAAVSAGAAVTLKTTGKFG